MVLDLAEKVWQTHLIFIHSDGASLCSHNWPGALNLASKLRDSPSFASQVQVPLLGHQINPKPLSFNLPFFFFFGQSIAYRALRAIEPFLVAPKHPWAWLLLPGFYKNSAFPYSHPNGLWSPAYSILSFCRFHVQSLSYFFYKPLPKA